jgi:hypothetical protein
MVYILADDRTEPYQQSISELLGPLVPNGRSSVEVSAEETWHYTAEWNDVLIVLFDGPDLADQARGFIEQYRADHPSSCAIIPVAVGTARQPPNPIGALKAAVLDGSAESAERIRRSVAAFLGLALHPGRRKVFISYRAADGTFLAKDLYRRLQLAGFQPWLDEAEENLPFGASVQDTISENIKSAGLLLLLDTPLAPHSKWISVEIDCANAQLMPVLPIVVRDKRSRFVQLASLRRDVQIDATGPESGPLSESEWEQILAGIQDLLLVSHNRSLLLLDHAQRAFEKYEYSWSAVDERLRMYEAARRKQIASRVLAHCLVQDILDTSALRNYWDYVRNYPAVAQVNQKLCIYERETPLSDNEADQIFQQLNNVNTILAHYNELDLLIATGFQQLRN